MHHSKRPSNGPSKRDKDLKTLLAKFKKTKNINYNKSSNKKKNHA